MGKAAELQIRILRSLTGAQRLQIALEMSDLARELARAGIRSRHPDWSEAEVTRELVRYAFLPKPVPDWLEQQWAAERRLEDQGSGQ